MLRRQEKIIEKRKNYNKNKNRRYDCLSGAHVLYAFITGHRSRRSRVTIFIDDSTRIRIFYNSVFFIIHYITFFRIISNYSCISHNILQRVSFTASWSTYIYYINATVYTGLYNLLGLTKLSSTTRTVDEARRRPRVYTAQRNSYYFVIKRICCAFFFRRFIPVPLSITVVKNIFGFPLFVLLIFRDLII